MTTAIFAILYLAIGTGKAMLRITGHNLKVLDVSIIHETIAADATLISLAGDGETVINVQDGESLTLLVRASGRIIASAVLDVDTALVEKLGAIAIPVGSTNMIIDQCEFGAIQRVCQCGLEHSLMVEEGAQVL